MKPADISNFVVEDNPAYRPGGAVDLDVDLFGDEREILEATPFIASYRYRCEDRACKGHKQSLVDWESGQLARRNLRDQNQSTAKAFHRQRFFDEMCGAGRDTHFYVGNQHQHPQSFLVLGLFWPPKGERPQPMLEF